MKILKKILTITFLFLLASSAISQIEINLKKSFIESIKDKITVTLDYNLDAANDRNIDVYPDFYSPRGQSIKQSRNSTVLILAGRNDFIGLPLIAKVFNVKADSKAIDIVSNNKGNIIRLNGVWRLWCDYLENDNIIQGANNEVIKDYNSKHVFELAPVLRINKENLNGFDEKINAHRLVDAETAIGKYSSAKCRIVINDSIVTLITQGLVYDYADFTMQLNSSPEIKDDGMIIFCDVFGDNDNLLFKNLKMVFIKNSEPEKTVRKLSKGDRLKVLGIPRIDLNEIDSRIKISETDKQVLDGNLPFEMIILSVLDN